MTPFGKQVVGISEKERESREKCREIAVKVNIKIPKGAKQGHSIKTIHDVGHQTPGKIPGKVVLKVSRGSPTDVYTIAENDLHTVIYLSLEEALFGFSFSWKHLGDENVAISRERSTNPDEVLRLPKKGLAAKGNSRGDLFVRLAMVMPKPEKGTKSLSFEAPASREKIKPELVKEDEVELKDGGAWRRWHNRENAKTVKEKNKAKEEL